MSLFTGKSRLLTGTLLASIAISAPTQSAAQQAEPAKPAATPKTVSQEVIVTGSRIPRPQYEGQIPGVQIGKEAIEKRSFINAADILNELPLVGTGANFLGNNGGQSASLGVAYIDLLDLGTARTLTLVNGRRFVSNNAGTIFVSGNETGSQVDVNNIPVGLIDRIDVLTVGGSAAYGSDAISGVVNYVLKDKYEGTEFSVLGGATSYGDGKTATFRALAGRNFFNDRANAVVSFEYNQLDPIFADARPFRADNPTAVTNFANGSSRNRNFAPTAAIDVTNLNNGAFLRAADDGIPATAYLRGGARNVGQWPGGVVFTTTTATLPGPATPGVTSGGIVGGNAAGSIVPILAGNTQLIPGVPAAGQANATGNFATNGQPVSTLTPSALPTGLTAASVFTSFGVTPPAGLTAAQQTALAVNILQNSRQTAREYFAANPNTPLNAFVGSYITAFPDVATTGPLASVLPRTAVPLRFDPNGALQTFSLGSLTPTTPGTVGAAPGSDGFNPVPYTLLRIQQERQIANFNAHFDITPNIRLFTENLYSRVNAANPRNLGSANTLASGTTENAVLIMNVNNPFLTAQNRADLSGVGITNNFLLARSNVDIFPDNAFRSISTTERSAVGLKGDFDWRDRAFTWELSYTTAEAKGTVRTSNIKDVEFALAIDAAVDPASGRIVCRSQLNPSAFIGTTPAGIFSNVVRLPGADGIGRDQLFTPTVTVDMINSCQPLNVFGENRMSEAARQYVQARTQINSLSKQKYWQGVVTGEAFDVPAGAIAFSLSGEYREETLDYTTDPISRLGRTRTASASWTSAETTTTEYGAEVRLPIFSPDFNFPLLRELDFTVGSRWVQLEGIAPSFRDIDGVLRTQNYEGDVEQIKALSLNYKPLEDIRVRGNVTRAIRQPSVVELFLSGQPFFTSSGDPCSTANINLGPRPATRRANCIADVVRRGIAADPTAAAAFLNSYVPTGAAFQGLISGEKGLQPETAESWTAGIVIEPRFIKGLEFSADYIQLRIDDVIGPLLAQPAAEFCYDSPTFPDSSPQLGINSCTGLQRDATFNFTNGFVLPFYNLPSTKLRAWNYNFDYRRDLGELLRMEKDLGRVRFRGNAYQLMEYATSASGTFQGDKIRTDGTFARPTWRTQLNAEWRYKNLDWDWTWNWQDRTVIKSAGTPITIDTQSVLGYPYYSIHDTSVAWLLDDDKIRLQATIQNVFDVNAVGEAGYLNGAYADQLGRRFTISLRASF
jgi:outer membrane receptor protein involved in Fe transport